MRQGRSRDHGLDERSRVSDGPPRANRHAVHTGAATSAVKRQCLLRAKETRHDFQSAAISNPRSDGCVPCGAVAITCRLRRCPSSLRSDDTIRRPVPQRCVHRSGFEPEHRAPREPAETALRGTTIRLRRHRRHQHARRLQQPATTLHSFQRPHRPGHGDQRNGVPRVAGKHAAGRGRRGKDRRHQSGRVGPWDEHGSCGVR